jgi:hypothetical protein
LPGEPIFEFCGKGELEQFGGSELVFGTELFVCGEFLFD